MADHHLLNSVDLVIRQPGDYKLVRQNLSRNHPNFVYFDPPYRPLNETSSFKEYSNDPFGDIQQEELKVFYDRLSNQSCLLMLSNSDSKTENGDSYFEVLYEGYDIQRVLASRFINADPEKRKKLTEVVIRNY
jgi:DNA adenine methylase